MQQLQAAQRSMLREDEMLGFTAAIPAKQSPPLHPSWELWGSGFWGNEGKESSECYSCCAAKHQEFLRTMGMAVIRFEGGEKELE